MSESFDTELKKTQDEVSRLVRNRAAFYEIMSDMIFLIRNDYQIEDMNQSAISTFGDLRGKFCHKALHGLSQPCANVTCPVNLTARDQRFNELIERQIDDITVEYSYVPFQGYQGDKLVMIVMRDVSKRKKHELEIAEFNNNIEHVLRVKIEDLNESEKMRTQLTQEINILQKELDRLNKSDEMIGESKRIREIREMIYQVADTTATILITGESGTGKELIADLVHKHSSRRKKPYLKFNCAAVSESLLESDLFGYEKGSFTGATSNRKGKFEIANEGTMFLDEIGDISPKMQASLLRVLQNGEIIRVGGTSPIKVDVRIIAATNAELASSVENGSFRKDLYYRLNVINLHQPPLRERKEDIVLLTSHFIKKYRAAFKKDIDFLPSRIINYLLLHDWPGNIRELENVIQRAVLLTKNNTISEKELDIIANPTNSPNSGGAMISSKMYEQPIKDSLADVEEKIISGTMMKCGGKALDVAEVLKIGKTALYSKMKRYGISAKETKR